MHNVYQKDSEFIKELYRIIEQQGFQINPGKVRLQKKEYRQEVTGLLVNKEVNVQKRFIKQLRMWLYYWERYGFEKASSFFNLHYYTDKGHVKSASPDMAMVIKGKLDYLKMVKGANNPTFLKLYERFIILVNKEKGIPALKQILDVWEDEGLEEAMKTFNF